MTLTLRSGRPASRFAFGTMQFGARADEAASRAMFEAARAKGINHFDTAVRYAEGRSEEILGRLAKDCRDDLYIATKVAYAGGAGRDNIRAQYDTCRRQLGMDDVDLLYLHRFDPETPLEDSMEALAELRQAGQIRHVGLSNFAAWQVMKAIAVAARFDLSIDAIQPMYNLVKRQAEVELLPMAKDQGLAVLPYSPLGGGLLTGKYARGEEGRLSTDKMYASRYAPGWMGKAAEGLLEIASGLGVDPATLAVAWVASQEAAPMPIVSARSAEQLAPSLAALDFEMTPELRARLSALTPTPAPATDRLEEL